MAVIIPIILIFSATASAVALTHTDFDVPSTVGLALQQIEPPLGFAGECIDRFPQLGLTQEYQLREDRYWALVKRVEETWDRQPNNRVVSSERKWKSACTRPAVQIMLKEVDSSLDSASSELEQAITPLKVGAWVGPLRLCNETVTSAEIGKDSYTEQSTLSISLTLPAKEAFATITRRRTGKPLAMRVNGIVISDPIIREAIVGGVFQITGPDQTTLEQARSVMLQGC